MCFCGSARSCCRPLEQTGGNRLKLISWNVNGLRACVGKGFLEFFRQEAADVFCIQETKMQPEQLELDLPGYQKFFNSAERKGYSGTAVFAKIPPLSVQNGIGIPEHDTEGRVITLEYSGFYLVTVYTPNSQHELTRLSYRMEWESVFLDYLKCLDAVKPVIVCGDMNVAHREIDLKNPKENEKNAGFTIEERTCMTRLLDAGFTDTFRLLYPTLGDAYTWWSYRMRARSRNVGWRIDYFLVSDRIADCVTDSVIYKDIMGSDHCPVEVVIGD